MTTMQLSIPTSVADGPDGPIISSTISAFGRPWLLRDVAFTNYELFLFDSVDRSAPPRWRIARGSLLLSEQDIRLWLASRGIPVDTSASEAGFRYHREQPPQEKESRAALIFGPRAARSKA